jgi:hypothetical protein
MKALEGFFLRLFQTAFVLSILSGFIIGFALLIDKNIFGPLVGLLIPVGTYALGFWITWLFKWKISKDEFPHNVVSLILQANNRPKPPTDKAA